MTLSKMADLIWKSAQVWKGIAEGISTVRWGQRSLQPGERECRSVGEQTLRTRAVNSWQDQQVVGEMEGEWTGKERAGGREEGRELHEQSRAQHRKGGTAENGRHPEGLPM